MHPVPDVMTDHVGPDLFDVIANVFRDIQRHTFTQIAGGGGDYSDKTPENLLDNILGVPIHRPIGSENPYHVAMGAIFLREPVIVMVVVLHCCLPSKISL